MRQWLSQLVLRPTIIDKARQRREKKGNNLPDGDAKASATVVRKAT